MYKRQEQGNKRRTKNQWEEQGNKRREINQWEEQGNKRRTKNQWEEHLSLIHISLYQIPPTSGNNHPNNCLLYTSLPVQKKKTQIKIQYVLTVINIPTSAKT